MRLRSLLPAPHVAEHAPHAPQEPHDDSSEGSRSVGQWVSRSIGKCKASYGGICKVGICMFFFFFIFYNLFLILDQCD